MITSKLRPQTLLPASSLKAGHSPPTPNGSSRSSTILSFSWSKNVKMQMSLTVRGTGHGGYDSCYQLTLISRRVFSRWEDIIYSGVRLLALNNLTLNSSILEYRDYLYNTLYLVQWRDLYLWAGLPLSPHNHLQHWKVYQGVQGQLVVPWVAVWQTVLGSTNIYTVVHHPLVSSTRPGLKLDFPCWLRVPGDILHGWQDEQIFFVFGRRIQI